LGSSSFSPFGILHHFHVRIFHFRHINSAQIANKKDDFATKITSPYRYY